MSRVCVKGSGSLSESAVSCGVSARWFGECRVWCALSVVCLGEYALIIERSYIGGLGRSTRISPRKNQILLSFRP